MACTVQLAGWDIACSFVFGVPCQFCSLAGLGHRETIPFVDITFKTSAQIELALNHDLLEIGDEDVDADEPAAGQGSADAVDSPAGGVDAARDQAQRFDSGIGFGYLQMRGLWRGSTVHDAAT
jgi:hypothetical protein